MNFSIPQKELTAALARCAAICAGSRSSMPILTHVLLEPLANVLKICATDLEIGYTTGISGIIWNDSDLVSDGDFPSFLLPAKILHDCVKAIPSGEVTFAVDNNSAVISGGTATFTLTGLDAAEFPGTALEQGRSLTIGLSGLVTSLQRVCYCQSKDEKKPNLCGCHLLIERNVEGDLFAVAATTDGHRLCLDTNAMEFGEDAIHPDEEQIPAALLKGVIIPAKGVAEIIKLIGNGPALLGMTGNHLTISLGDEILSIQLVEGEFPDVNRVIPEKPEHAVQVKRQPLIDALERCRIITNKDSRGVDLDTTDSALVIASALPMIGAQASDCVTGEITGLPPALRLNVEYLLQALGNMPGASIELRITDELSPIIINPIGTDFPQAIVMPMRGA